MIDSAEHLFLGELIDDAGLFPPASFSMERALEGYLREVAGPERWMMGRFIVPVTRLRELLEQKTLLEGIERMEDRSLPTSIVFDAPLPRPQYAAVAAYLKSRYRPLAIHSIEVRIPRTASVDGAAHVRAVLEELGEAKLPPEIDVYLEVPFDAQSMLVDVLEAIADQRRSSRSMLHAKFRCGGPRADLTPDPKDIAFFLVKAHKRMVPFKLTAGLHAPIRRYDPVSGFKVHGFLNVVGAAILTHAFDLDAHTITQMLFDEDPEHFQLDESCFAWKEYAVDAMTIFDARTAFVRSFGSCSFREPVDYLIGLGILQDAVR